MPVPILAAMGASRSSSYPPVGMRHLGPGQRLRDPAGAARVQDGQRRAGLGDRSGDAGQMGPRLHPGQVRKSVQCLGFLGVEQLVLNTTKDLSPAVAVRLMSAVRSCLTT